MGVRIEDDMLMTDTGVVWLTKDLPRKISDIETFMKSARSNRRSARIDTVGARLP
ncbi:MAG: hypothetical protein ACR2IH_11025 [Pyrinomonadaceae bacterium]